MGMGDNFYNYKINICPNPIVLTGNYLNVYSPYLGSIILFTLKTIPRSIYKQIFNKNRKVTLSIRVYVVHINPIIVSYMCINKQYYYPPCIFKKVKEIIDSTIIQLESKKIIVLLSWLSNANKLFEFNVINAIAHITLNIGLLYDWLLLENDIVENNLVDLILEYSMINNNLIQLNINDIIKLLRISIVNQKAELYGSIIHILQDNDMSLEYFKQTDCFDSSFGEYIKVQKDKRKEKVDLLIVSSLITCVCINNIYDVYEIRDEIHKLYKRLYNWSHVSFLKDKEPGVIALGNHDLILDLIGKQCNLNKLDTEIILDTDLT